MVKEALAIRAYILARLGGYVRMSIQERREVVANATAEGHSAYEIAEFIGVNHATVSRDVANATAIDAVAALAADDSIRTSIERDGYTPMPSTFRRLYYAST